MHVQFVSLVNYAKFQRRVSHNQYLDSMTTITFRLLFFRGGGKQLEVPVLFQGRVGSQLDLAGQGWVTCGVGLIWAWLYKVFREGLF